MRKQYVNSKPAKEFVETYKTKSGQTKNRYRKATGVKVVKMIRHVK